MNPFDWSARSHPEVRQRTEEREEQLSKFAARSRESPDRDHPEEPDPMRTAYQIDRDRVIHSKAFRRLKHKTQVFIAPVGERLNGNERRKVYGLTDRGRILLETETSRLESMARVGRKALET